MTFRNGQARWAFDLSTWRPTFNDLLLATACIQSEEKQRLAKFLFREDFNASLIGRLLMRKFVCKATGLPYDGFRFSRDSKGKPYLDKDLAINVSSNLHVDFNVSHQGSYSVLAGLVLDNSKHVGRGKAPQSVNLLSSTDASQFESNNKNTKIGVDIMRIEYTGGKTIDDFFRLMHKNFSSFEWSSIQKECDEKNKLTAFMRHWCLKESYVKNIGVGITVDLQKISFHVGDALRIDKITTNTLLEVNGILQRDWRFEETLLDKDHIVTVSISNPLDNIIDANYEVLCFKDLMKDYRLLHEPDETYVNSIILKDYKY